MDERGNIMGKKKAEEKPWTTRIVNGFVRQTYEGGRCITQEFVAGEEVWEDDNDEPIDEPEDIEKTFPMHMVQPPA